MTSSPRRRLAGALALFARLAFLLALIPTLVMAAGTFKAALGVVIGYVLVCALIHNAAEARRLYVAEHRTARR